MALTLTQNAFNTSQKNEITPQIVLEIDGVDTIYGAVLIKKIVKIGDFEIGQPGVFIGGQIAIEDQESVISFQSGTSTEISQTLNLDKGTNESISSMKIALIDRGEKITKLITPGEIVDDVLGRKCKVWLGFPETSWKDDYIVIFRGIIDGIDAKSGVILLNLASPDVKKRGTIFPKGQTKLLNSMTNVQTTADVESTDQFLAPYTGPNGLVDESLKLYLRIDDEIMRYEGVGAGEFNTLTRGVLNTNADTHDSGATVDSFYVIEGNAIDTALKLMLSGTNGDYVTGLTPTNFVRISPTETIANCIFFQNFDLRQEVNAVVGDYVSISGASNVANNEVNKQILEIVEVDNGWYLVIDGVSFVEELSTSATVNIRSQYDVYGVNAGMAMANDEVDITQHLDLKNKYFTSADYRFYLKDTIESGQEFLAEKVYNPLAMFSIPRKAQASVGLHIGPIPGVNIKTLDTSNVLNASAINLQRTVNKNFYNSVIYRFQEDSLEEKFLSGDVVIDGTSITQIPVGNKPLIIDANGLRDDLSGLNLAQQAGNRRLRKYKFGAEFITNLEVNFKTGFDVEIGDKVIVNLKSLKMADINTGSRNGEPRLFEVVNKKLRIATGRIGLDLVDTNFNLDVRYGLVGPASKVKSAVSDTQLVIKPSYNTSRYGTNEYKKWENFIGAFVKVHNSDFSVSGTSFIDSIVGNTIFLSSSLGFTPLEDYVMEFGDYGSQPDNVKLVYAFQSDGSNNFADGRLPYQMS